MTHMIGSSLSLCLRDIIRGEVDVDDVAFIITSTAYSSAAEMEAGLRASISSKDVEKAIELAHLLWDTGRIFQPTVRPAGRRRTNLIWAHAPAFFDGIVTKPEPKLPVS